jgi:hypothetical protein
VGCVRRQAYSEVQTFASCEGCARVLLCHADADAFAADVKAKLDSLVAFALVDTFLCNWRTPSLADLKVEFCSFVFACMLLVLFED